ncbi:MAG TPA: HAMP domain-containing sensor histidine kinase [Ktedonosporobacter sp.]|nr:HAMP domain-containing sensor histidine kinase [Ktedonosporobacter sp.]
MSERSYRVDAEVGGTSRPLFEENRGVSNNAPPWLRPFFSLRAQLLFAYSMLLTLVVVILCTLISRALSPFSILIIAIGMVVLGSLLAFVFTSWLLRPLWRVTDAAQAIAIGDLEQRERLPLRLPPQDEVDRLAGSINEMVLRLELAEEAQHVSEQRFKRFFSDASHQLRTPLTSIRGFTEILMRGAIDDPETRQRVLTRMKSEAERMTNLINDILTLARLDNGQPPKLQYVDLIELATEGVKRARGQASEGCKVIFSLNTKERLGVQADRERLKQLLFILLDNAIKHGCSTPEGTITLQLDKLDKQAIIHVIDNGEGIAREDLEHIFDSFYRAHHRSSTHPERISSSGAGLGLAIADTIVRAHHGAISVKSEPGKGAEFIVSLPCI